jgi:hypothetical protein
MLRAAPLHAASLFAIWRESAQGPGRVKTCLGEGCAELFSQLPSSERSCQYNRLPHRRNRDGSSPRKLGIRVFTQPGSFATGAYQRQVRPYPLCRRKAEINLEHWRLPAQRRRQASGNRAAPLRGADADLSSEQAEDGARPPIGRLRPDRCPPCPDNDQIRHRSEVTRCAINGGRQPYSITSSARPSNVAGVSMPSALAAPTSLVVPVFHSHCRPTRTAQSDSRPRLRPLMGRLAPPRVPCPRILGQLNL